MSRRRNTINACPPHIDPRKLPVGCYWDKSGSGHWFTTFKADGSRKRKKIAGPDASLGDLHKAMEAFAAGETGNLIWLGGLFRASVQYKQVMAKTRADWDYCARVVEAVPSRRAGLTMGKAPLADWDAAVCQKLIDYIATDRGPSAAAHCSRYLRRVLNWGANRGHIKRSPMGKIEMPQERKLRRLPDVALVSKLVAAAKVGGALPANTKGSCPPFIWIVLVIAYRCRLRGAEVFDLTDANLQEAGLLCARRKGSNDNVTRWSDDLRAAVRDAQAYRDALWAAKAMPVPLRPDHRPLLVTQDGIRIKAFGWQNAWRRFWQQMLKGGAVEAGQYFGLHDMKRRGITDTKGGRAAKLEGGGHRDPNMLPVYDFELPLVDAAGD